eukprot:6198869-Pleurochrysis_carterae.AAC.2
MLPIEQDNNMNLSRPCRSVPQAMLNMAAAWSRRRPILLACTSTTVKTVAADLLVQKMVERRETLDTKRTLAFAIFGCSWMGAGQYFVCVNHLRERLEVAWLTVYLCGASKPWGTVTECAGTQSLFPCSTMNRAALSQYEFALMHGYHESRSS